MRIGCIGWGSLIWNPGELLVEKIWREDGPSLPVEFLRVSNNGRLTLVLHESAELTPCYWAMMTIEDIDEAIESLRKREGCLSINPIGVIRKNDRMSESYVHKLIHTWLEDQELDAVIWTNLGSKFKGRNGISPTLEEAIEYLKELPKKEKELAENYIRKTPTNIRTKYRDSFEEVFQWFPDNSK